MPHQEYFPNLAAKQATRNVLAIELTAITNFNIATELSATLSTPNMHDNKCGVAQAASTKLIAEGITVQTKETRVLN